MLNLERVHTKAFHERFIKAMRQIMIEQDLATNVEAAAWLGIGDKTLLKIMSGGQAPTTEHGIILCLKGGVDANWLFLGKGPLYYEETQAIGKLSAEISKLTARASRMESELKTLSGKGSGLVPGSNRKLKQT